MKSSTIPVLLLLLLLNLTWLGGSHGRGLDEPSLQKRAGGANQNYNQQAYPTVQGGQYPYGAPSKGGQSGQLPTSSASRAQPDLLQWVRFW
ncbi:dermokine-like [Dromiciops gliroides]|uniref:dermokine-like n=1 Tax=Dromiciops gliroides TaxID=33562 RepID=UPI001CC7B8FF|nr:dermokine-like [Dromiciops gliroides]